MNSSLSPQEVLVNGSSCSMRQFWYCSCVNQVKWNETAISHHKREGDAESALFGRTLTWVGVEHNTSCMLFPVKAWENAPGVLRLCHFCGYKITSVWDVTGEKYMALIKKWRRRSSCGHQRRQQPRRTSQSRSQQGGLGGTKGLLIRKENVRRDTSLFPTSAVTAGTAAPSTWNVYFCQGIVSIFELFVVVPSEHLCDPPKRQLPRFDQRSRNGAREMVAFQVTMQGILGNGALRRLGGRCCQLVPRWTTAIIDACVKKEARRQPHFLSLFFVGDSFWVASFIHLVWKKILGVAFTSCFSATRPPKSAETTPLLISSLPVSTVPAPRHDFQSTRSPETDKWQKLPKLHFPKLLFFHLTSDPTTQGIYFERPLCHSVFSKHHRSMSVRIVRLEPPVPSGCSASHVWFHSAPYRRRRTLKRATFASEVFYEKFVCQKVIIKWISSVKVKRSCDHFCTFIIYHMMTSLFQSFRGQVEGDRQGWKMTELWHSHFIF